MDYDIALVHTWATLGITWQEFMDTPHDVIGKLLEMRSAQSEGQDRRLAESQKNNKK